MNNILAGSTIILTDSRALTRPAETTFIALVTPSGDGHDFVGELFEKGVRQFIVSRTVDGEEKMEAAGAKFIHTSDTTQYLRQLGAEARDLFGGLLLQAVADLVLCQMYE